MQIHLSIIFFLILSVNIIIFNIIKKKYQYNLDCNSTFCELGKGWVIRIKYSQSYFFFIALKIIRGLNNKSCNFYILSTTYRVQSVLIPNTVLYH